jgi:hypothetical protein
MRLNPQSEVFYRFKLATVISKKLIDIETLE